MSDNKIIQFTPKIPPQFRDWFWAPPLLSAEDRQIHDRILSCLYEAIKPRDPFECIHIGDLAYNLSCRLRLRRLRESVIRHVHNGQFEQREREILQDAERRKLELRRLYEAPPWRRHASGRDPLVDTKFAVECEINQAKLNQKLAAIDAESDQKLAEVQKAKDGPIDEAGCFDQWIDKVERIEKQLEDVDDNIRITYRLLDDHRTGLGQHLTRLGDVVDVEVAEEAAPASEEVVDRAESVDRTEIGAALTEPTGASAVAERPSPVSLQIKGGTPIQSAAPAPAVLPRSSTPTEQQ